MTSRDHSGRGDGRPLGGSRVRGSGSSSGSLERRGEGMTDWAKANASRL